MAEEQAYSGKNGLNLKSAQSAFESWIETKNPLKKPITLLVLFVFYYFAAKGGLKFAFANASATAIWPPTGIALASMLIFGYWVWPSIFVGAFFVNLMTAGTVTTSLGIAFGNTLEGIVGAYLINRFACGKNAFDFTGNIFKFALFGAIISTMVSATIGVTTLYFGSYVSSADYGTVWLTWWIGDSVGNLIIAPLIILWATNPFINLKRYQIFEALLLLVSSVLIGLIVFGGIYTQYPLEFLYVPLVLWAAFRFRRRETITIVFVLSMIAISGTLNGFGHFASSSRNESLLMLQMFMGIISITALSVAALMAERKVIHQEMLKSHMECERLLKKQKIHFKRKK